MKAIVIAIISGFFSLAGIWYQNYVNRRSAFNTTNNVSPKTTALPEAPFPAPQDHKPAPRIFFTILITALPWVIWKLLLAQLTGLVYKYMNTYAKIMVVYFSTWIIITVIAMASGWKLKTFFEKLILIVSLGFLLYWSIWMIAVHHLV